MGSNTRDARNLFPTYELALVQLPLTHTQNYAAKQLSKSTDVYSLSQKTKYVTRTKERRPFCFKALDNRIAVRGAVITQLWNG